MKRTNPWETYVPVGTFQNELSFATNPWRRILQSWKDSCHLRILVLSSFQMTIKWLAISLSNWWHLKMPVAVILNSAVIRFANAGNFINPSVVVKLPDSKWNACGSLWTKGCFSDKVRKNHIEHHENAPDVDVSESISDGVYAFPAFSLSPLPILRSTLFL